MPQPLRDADCATEPGGATRGRENLVAVPGDFAAVRPERRPGSRRRIPIGMLALLGLALVAVPNVLGFSYYVARLSERVRSPLHAWYRPSGYVGLSAGIAAGSLFLFLWLYPLRKRVRRLAFLGSQARMLDLHIAAGLVIPLLAATHAAWRFSGLIGLGYAAMLVVCLSGIVGRYIYVRMPRSRSGVLLGLEEIATERRRVLQQLCAATGLAEQVLEEMLRVTPISRSGAGFFGTVRQLVADDVTRRRAGRALMSTLRDSGTSDARLDPAALRGAMKLARREMALHQQFRMIDGTQRIFRFWHVAHLPVAVTALVAVAVHVILVLAMGGTRFR